MSASAAQPTIFGVVGTIMPGSTAKFDELVRAYRGRPVVVNFWATWCDPCTRETPRIVAAAQHYAGRVGFIGIDSRDDPVAAARFVRAQKMPYVSLSDRGPILNAQHILGLPVTQFYDPDGKLSSVHQGEIQSSDLSKQIEAVLAAKPTPT